MSRSDLVYVHDIIESIGIIVDYVEGKTEDDLINNIMLQDAVIRRFGIIGEASSKISKQFKVQHPDIPWRLIKAMRNKLIHEYFGISAKTIFATVKTDLPVLKEQLQNLIS
ncbi:DUF86 domain-containing protein [uncultured Mucilaginibacter sp.]|uniref:HepT-like ribonuclease domain-containing protein n=1 Tax=uncultured Mucilaginibacter sp. TaxID=797541 RepID=UPI0026079295|nr:DUF86 domain-containing protein [uncultured Mucilaginibacter sp.]